MNEISRGSVFSVGYRLCVVPRVRGSNLKGVDFINKILVVFGKLWSIIKMNIKIFRNIWETLVINKDEY